MTSSEPAADAHDPSIPATGPWGTVHTVTRLGDEIWQVQAESGRGLVIDANEGYEVDLPLQPPGHVTEFGHRDLRWVSEGIGADIVRLYYAAWGRIPVAEPERARLARSIALRVPGEWLMAVQMRRQAIPDPADDPVLVGQVEPGQPAEPAQHRPGRPDLLQEGMRLWLRAEHGIDADDAEIAELTAWAPRILEVVEHVRQAMAAAGIPERMAPLVIAAALYRAIGADGEPTPERISTLLDVSATELRRTIRSTAMTAAYLWLSRFAPDPAPVPDPTPVPGPAPQPGLFTVETGPPDPAVIEPPVTVGRPSPWGPIIHVEQALPGIVSARTRRRRLLILSFERALAMPPGVASLGTVSDRAVCFRWPDAAAVRLFYGSDLGLEQADRDRIELELARHDQRAWNRWRMWSQRADPRRARGVFGAALRPGESGSAERLRRGDVIVAAGQPLIVTTGPIRARTAETDPTVIEALRRAARGPVAVIVPPDVDVQTALVDMERVQIVGPSPDRHDDWVEQWELVGPHGVCARVRLWRDDRSMLSAVPNPRVDVTTQILIGHLVAEDLMKQPERHRTPVPVAEPNGPAYVYRGEAGLTPFRRPGGQG